MSAMEETVIDQIEENVTEPVEDAAEATAQEANLMYVVDTPAASGETEEPVAEGTVDIEAIEVELPEAPEMIAPDAEIAPDEEPVAERRRHRSDRSRAAGGARDDGPGRPNRAR